MKRKWLVHLSVMVLAPTTSFAMSEDAIVVTSIHVYPPNVSLVTAHDVQRLVVIVIDEAGITHDVTNRSEIGLADPSLARCEGSVIHPLADGSTTVTVSYGDQSLLVPLVVRKARQPRPISFRLDVIPVITRAGCNSGSCHGSGRGQDGFRLSLFGFDPDGDWQRLTHELAGRRVNLAFPDDSLLLEKPTGAVPHTGGKRFERTSASYETLRRWIASNVPNDSADVVQVTGIELYPPEVVMGGADQSVQLVVVANYSDGSTRDVTDLTVFRTNNEISADVLDGGRLTGREPGEAFITAGYDTYMVGSPVIVLPDEATFFYSDPADGGAVKATYIDEHIATKLRKLRRTPAPLCTDGQFIRRVFLDVIGLLPSPAAHEAFLADESPDNRDRLVERLLQRREFVDLWVMQWAELLQIRSNQRISEKAALLYFEWVRNAIGSNVPIDRMVRDILTATGGTFSQPPTNFYQNQADTLVLSENVAQAFLGIRIQCAQCHNHPFDRWTQDDYYGFAAFFPQVGRKRAEDSRETIVFDRRRGEVTHPVGGRVMVPKFLGGATPDVKGKDRRMVVARWLTSKENPYFARSFANRVWAHFMGVGIVEPVDDFRVSNPASNAPLLDALADRLRDYDYDFNRLVRDICASRAYQRSTAVNDTNRDDNRNCSHALIRRLRGETILDILCQVTETSEKYKGLPLGARAVQIADGTTSNYFLTTFGRAKRDTVAACEVNREPSLSQALHLLNGRTVNEKIVQGNVVGRMLDAGQTPEAIIDELFLRCLGRSMTADERATLLAEVESSENVKQALEDVFWAILNSQEFIFNH